jgi:hypothetical protein
LALLSKNGASCYTTVVFHALQFVVINRSELRSCFCTSVIKTCLNIPDLEVTSLLLVIFLLDSNQ